MAGPSAPRPLLGIALVIGAASCFATMDVITSYSIHYTKLYEVQAEGRGGLQLPAGQQLAEALHQCPVVHAATTDEQLGGGGQA